MGYTAMPRGLSGFDDVFRYVICYRSKSIIDRRVRLLSGFSFAVRFNSLCFESLYLTFLWEASWVR
jgi:hypothetical protein